MLEEHSKLVNIEEALDLAMLMPFSPISSGYRRRIIPYWNAIEKTSKNND